MKKLFFLPFFMCLLLLAACTSDMVRLAFTNAKDEVPQLSNMQFRFSKDLVSDDMLNTWQDENYITFSPKISGRFKWNTKRELEFSPSHALQPATIYTAKLNASLVKKSKFKKLAEPKISFSTPALALENMHSQWTLSALDKKVIPEILLEFNYEVDPEKIKNDLQVKLDNNEMPFQIISSKKSKIIKIALGDVKSEDRDYKVSLRLKKGALPILGSKGTEKESIHNDYLSSPFQLYINDLQAQHDGQEGSIQVMTSQNIDDVNAIKKYIKINPLTEFTLQEYEGGFLIKSDKFFPDNSYEISFNKGMKGSLGGLLSESLTRAVSFGELEPEISFATEGDLYLSKNGNKNIEVKINNVQKVKVTLSKIYEKNLLATEHYGYYPDTDNDAYYYDDNASTDFVKGDIIYEKEIDTKTLARNLSGSRLYNLVPQNVLSDYNGIYHLSIRSEDDYWVSDSRYISLSDIGLIGKVGKNKISVYANSIASAQPLSNIAVSVYGANNILLCKGSTNNLGIVHMDYNAKAFKGFEPAMIIAQNKNDFNYLPFSKTGISTSRYDVGGKETNKVGLDLFIYPERNMYRPGEKVHIGLIARKNDRSNIGEMPILWKVLRPDGSVFLNQKTNLNEEGVGEIEFETTTASLTGSYILQCFQGDNLLLNQMAIGVEEFVPDKIKVDVNSLPTKMHPGEKAEVKINARNYFGPPAANRKYELNVEMEEKKFSAPGYEKYDFSFSEKDNSYSIDVQNGQTNAQGEANTMISIPEKFANSGLLQANVFTTVFDENGRPVSKTQKIDIFTQKSFIGIYGMGYNYFPLKQNAKFNLVALDENKKEIQSKVHVDIIKHDYKNVLTKNGKYYSYESQSEDKILESKDININGKATYFFMPMQSGDYEIRLRLPGSDNYVSNHFYSYGSWGQSNAFEINKEGAIEIALDKQQYKNGDKANLLFKTPFDGKLLVTVENENVISEQYLDVKDKSASLNVALGEKELPGVYIHATLFKPHSESAMPLTVAHGIQFIKVESEKNKMHVSITANKNSRSKQKQKIKIKADPGAMITLAAVDNGILAVNHFKSPSPYDFFFAKKKLGVKSYDMYALLFPELVRKLSYTGGDRFSDLNQRLNPIQGKEKKLFSYWSGFQKCNGSGIAEIELDIPEFTGELRLMVVAVKNNKFGMHESTMTVADPIVISAALPRFLSLGDSIPVPIFISNTTKNIAQAQVKLKSSAQLICSNENQVITIPAESEVQLMYTARTANQLGMANLEIEVQALNEIFTSKNTLSIRPASPLISNTESGFIASGSSKQINFSSADFLAFGNTRKLVVGRSPLIELGNHFSQLVNYPYGCSEQIISAAYPQLYYADLAQYLKTGNNKSKDAVYNVDACLKQLLSRQHSSGGIKLWDGAETEHWWASVYAADFMLEAKKAGYDVSKNSLDLLLNYLSARLRSKEFIKYYYNGNQVKQIVAKEIPYSLYVLAKAQRANIPIMNYYKANKKDLALDGQYLLSAAYAIAGDKNSFKQLLPNAITTEIAQPISGGSFYSANRDAAIALNVLLDADPQNAQIVSMSRYLIQLMKNKRYCSTQENAFALLALGKIARLEKNNNAKATLTVQGKNYEIENGIKSFGPQELGKGIADIKVIGNGKMYYYWETRGLKKDASFQAEDKYIHVHRSYYNRFGQEISGQTFHQNDLVIIKITLEKKYDDRIDNIVINDLLPAGFEIENARIKEVQGMQWVKDASKADYIDVRDDRALFFVNAYSQKQYYYYAVRAVSAGKFKQAPLSADAMYRADIHSVNGGGMIHILPATNNAL